MLWLEGEGEGNGVVVFWMYGEDLVVLVGLKLVLIYGSVK